MPGDRHFLSAATRGAASLTLGNRLVPQLDAVLPIPDHSLLDRSARCNLSHVDSWRERGRYGNPELYGAPAEQGIFPALKFAAKKND